MHEKTFFFFWSEIPFLPFSQNPSYPFHAADCSISYFLTQPTLLAHLHTIWKAEKLKNSLSQWLLASLPWNSLSKLPSSQKTIRCEQQDIQAIWSSFNTASYVEVRSCYIHFNGGYSRDYNKTLIVWKLSAYVMKRNGKLQLCMCFVSHSHCWVNNIFLNYLNSAYSLRLKYLFMYSQ